MPLAAQLWTHALFLLIVADAVYAQAITGFVLALILLGVIGATNLVPLADAVNATTIIGLSTAWTFLWRRRAVHVERMIVPTLVGSALGIIAGALILTWLADTAYQVLRLIPGDRRRSPAPCRATQSQRRRWRAAGCRRHWRCAPAPGRRRG